GHRDLPPVRAEADAAAGAGAAGRSGRVAAGPGRREVETAGRDARRSAEAVTLLGADRDIAADASAAGGGARAARAGAARRDVAELEAALVGFGDQADPAGRARAADLAVAADAVGVDRRVGAGDERA